MNIEEMFVQRFINLENENKTLKIQNENLADANEKMGISILKLRKLIQEAEPTVGERGSLIGVFQLPPDKAKEFIDLFFQLDIKFEDRRNDSPTDD